MFALVQGLPPGSAVARDGKSWIPEHEFAALAVERADMWFHVLAQTMGAKASALPAPMAFSHPDRVVLDPEAKPKRLSDAAAVSRFFAQIGR